MTLVAACTAGGGDATESSADAATRSESAASTGTHDTMPGADATTATTRPGKSRTARTSASRASSGSSTTTLPPRQALVGELCDLLRPASFLEARRVLERGQRRFSDRGGTGFVQPRVSRRCPNAFRRYQRVQQITQDTERAFDALSSGPGFLDAIGCTAAGMQVRVTNRSHRPIGVMLIASFGPESDRVRGTPPVVIWRLGSGDSAQVQVPVGPRASGYRGGCSVVATPWISREHPPTTALWPLRDDGAPIKISDGRRDGLPRSIRAAFRFSDEFVCGGERLLLQGFVELRAAAFDRRRSAPRCVIGQRRPPLVCKTEGRFENYAVVEIKVPRTRIEIGGRRRVVEPATVEVGVMRRSPQDRRWRWVVEPQVVRTGPQASCSGTPALTVGGN